MEMHLTAGWVALAICFLGFNLGSVAVFKPAGELPLRLKMFLALVPTFQLASLGCVLFAPPAGWRQGLLIAGASASMTVFVAAVVSARRQRFGPIFGQGGDRIAHTGAFALVRHPFYSAYMLCYLSLAVAAGVAAVSAGALILVGLYVHSALAEERGLLRGPAAAAYRRYSQRTGRFLPRPGVARPIAPVAMGLDLSHTK